MRVKVRWLDTDRPVRYAGRKGAAGLRGQVLARGGRFVLNVATTSAAVCASL